MHFISLINLTIINFYSLPATYESFLSHIFFPRAVPLWNRIPKECFTYQYNLNLLDQNVVYPTYLHNIHFVTPFMFIQKPHFVILCLQCILSLELAEYFSNKNIFGILFSLAIRNMTEKHRVMKIHCGQTPMRKLPCYLVFF